jgi:hypothetical protein
LEPGACLRSENAHAIAAVIPTATITASKRARTFLSQAGPRVFLVFFKLSITSLDRRRFASENNKGDPLGRPHSCCYAADGRMPSGSTSE